jgi:glycosyltransferase involved in cell wall biosynthesis
MPENAARRLLLVTHRPFDYEGPGTVRWRYLMRALGAHGWDVEVVTSRHNVTRDSLAADDREARLAELRARVMVQVGRLMRPAWNRAGIQPEAFPPNTLWSWTARWMLRRKVAETQPAVVVTTIPPPSALFAVAGALRGGPPPLVVDMRDNWAGHPSYDAGGRLLRDVEGRALRRAAAVVAVTEGMREKLLRLHPWIGARLHLMPNGFDPKLLERRTPPLGAWPPRVTLIHPGVLYGDRGVGALLSAMGRRGLRDRVRLELVGNLDAASQRALRERPPGVEVEALPPMPWEATMERVAAADAVVVIVPASMGDDVAWPVKMFEGLALGKPIVTVTSGGAAERLLQELGRDQACARDGDPDSIAAALERLLAAPPPAPVEPERLRRWDRAAVASDYAGLLDAVADGRLAP